MTIIPVILCGGAGTRLWPVSRKLHPKQFLSLHGEHSLLQQTAQRLQGIPGVVAPLLISNQDLRFLVAEQLRSAGVTTARIVLEPAERNTAPAVAAAAHLALRQDQDALLLVLPSDHVIGAPARFRQYVAQAATLAQDGKLVTFGIRPTEPHTGYGYIRQGAALAGHEGAHLVSSFVEKPDRATAEAFIASGDYLWNSGMFLFKAALFLEELARLQPQMHQHVADAVVRSQEDLDFLRLDSAAFAACPAESIDYAVMEHTPHAAVIATSELGWNDIGSWSALADVSTPDQQGNALLGDVFAEDTRNSYIRSEARLVATVGVDDLIVVETADAVLVAHKAHVQGIKQLVDRLKNAGRGEVLNQRKVFRPWGSYESVDSGARFQVKRIVVNPGAALSLQMHHHRAEHWVVVKGTAKVTNGDKIILLSENQSTYIPLGTTHRLENPGKLPLEIIEVQSGSYLGEDDIVRMDDQYGRTQDKPA
ncbi:Alginate biosynthesis protein AlgA [Andreprevotia sp. IGB-42]|uniref:mannose-1-phosphate guanylyltransferase/mannose-6-phosphate isomerase n=1 Tax=Andreprevotia sp. IGB-42 TaxID=2497473 RepID=UPI00135A6821|nr:mannose-1-phosphate guanylyltransferase/mannose-6-phosphate isomerase [Andreprevotia sp. IGB-42]KAF0811503.1 Alginate biosynthesis protein AlgA [Andreprevotia sp. IGB-42]